MISQKDHEEGKLFVGGERSNFSLNLPVEISLFGLTIRKFRGVIFDSGNYSDKNPC